MNLGLIATADKIDGIAISDFVFHHRPEFDMMYGVACARINALQTKYAKQFNEPINLYVNDKASIHETVCVVIGCLSRNIELNMYIWQDKMWKRQTVLAEDGLPF